MTTTQKKKPYLIPGFHGVRDCLVQGRIRVQELWIAEAKKSTRAEEILRIAREKNIPVRFKKDTELSRLLPGIVHQGIVALAKEFIYSDLDHIIDISSQNQGRSLLIALDHITDEGNLGALIRTAAFFGTQGLIIPKDRAAGVSPTVLKRSSGGHIYLPIARVVNMARTMDLLQKKGFWIVGTSGESPGSIYEFDWDRDVVLVLGNEQKGLGRSVRQHCDQVVGIPSHGHMDSLNVAVAAGVVLSEIVRQRAARHLI